MITVVKIGGNIIDNPDKLNGFLGHFAATRLSKFLTSIKYFMNF